MTTSCSDDGGAGTSGAGGGSTTATSSTTTSTTSSAGGAGSGGSTTVGVGGGGTGGSPTGSGGSGGGLIGTPRLVLAATDGANHGVFLWDDPDTLASDSAPDVVVADASTDGARALAATPGALYVATDQTASALVVLGAASGVTASSVPSATIPRSALPSASAAPDRVVAAGSALILSSFMDGAYLFPNGGSLTSSSTPTVRFTHAFQQLPSVALDVTADRLFSGQISGAGLLAWNGASTATGAPASSFAVANTSLWDLAIAGGRLYGAGSFGAAPPAPGVGVWQTSSLTMSVAPSFVLGSAQGVNSFVEDIEADGNVLLVCMQGGTGGPRVLVWNDIGALSAPAMPDATISLGSAPQRAELSNGGRIYVMTTGAVSIYDDTTTPTLVTTLTGSGTLSQLADLAIAD